jgi:non-ribosomal peptide synthetase component F
MTTLPADRPRPAGVSGRGAVHESTLPPEIAEGVEAAAATGGGSRYAVLATAFATWLAEVCGTEAVVLATSSANRRKPEHERVVGLVGDAVLVRVRPGAGVRPEEVSAALFGGLDHQDLPLDDVVAAVVPDHADRQFPTVLFTVVTTPSPRLALPGVAARTSGLVVPGVARTELYVRIAEDRIYWEYSTDLFDATTVARWDADLHAVLARLVALERSTVPE